MATVGLKFSVSYDELVKHCLERCDYHTTRAAEKEATLPKLKESFEYLKSSQNSVLKMSNSYNSNPEDSIAGLKADIVEHKSKAHAFKFFADHFYPTVYELSEADLTRLEFIRSR